MNSDQSVGNCIKTGAQLDGLRLSARERRMAAHYLHQGELLADFLIWLLAVARKVLAAVANWTQALGSQAKAAPVRAAVR